MPDKGNYMGTEAKNKRIGAALFITVLTIMTAAAEFFQDREIIFPEIAALALGCFCMPVLPWRVNMPRMLFLIAGSAACGLCIRVFLPGSLYLKVLLAFTIAQLICLFSRTTLVPLISATVLPVLLESRSIRYLLSAALMTALIIILRLVLEQTGIREKTTFEPLPLPDRDALLRAAARIVVVAAVSAAALANHWNFVIAPPILVAFTGFSETYAEGKSIDPQKILPVFFLCAFLGSLSRFVLTMTLGLPLAVSAFCAAALILIPMYQMSVLLPPAGALAILAMLIPEQMVLIYPVEVLAGAVIFTAAAALCGRTSADGILDQ